MTLRQTQRTDQTPQRFLATCGAIVAEFGEHTQDSGNISYGLRTPDGTRYFVKTAGLPDDERWTLSHAERVDLLRNAVTISGIVSHPILPALWNVIESPHGPLLVYEWRSGENLHATSKEREMPESPYQRFRHLPPVKIVAALDGVFAVHARLAERGYVAVDFYDGAMLYDFTNHRLTLYDLDNYRVGAFTNTMGRMFGSTRYMAPEEFVRGATIDQGTTVFTLGRLLATFLGDGTLDRAPFRGTDAQFEAMIHACATKPEDRFASPSDFYRAWSTNTSFRT